MTQPTQKPSGGITIAIIGPGALGTLFAARLAQSHISTILFDYRAERAERLRKHGLRILDSHGTHTVHVHVTADPHELHDVDAALVLVKSHKTEDVAAVLAEYLPAHAAVFTLQNGLGNIETLQLHVGRDRVFGGTTAQGGLLEGVGIVRDTGGGTTILGHLDGTADARLDDFVQALLMAGFSVSITRDIRAALWNKVILNATINPVGALTGLRNGQLAEHEPSYKLMVAAAREAFSVARQHGINVDEQDWSARLHAICQATANNLNSMLQDVRHQRKTEIEAINGAIVRIAEQHGIQTPINRTLWYLVAALEQRYTATADQ
ncbi:MAG TPA: 2-dehydropantoate 2-reductase [Armatimonadota bacterium]|nr:2-dehydropantoate 2-reductase [Armatimonadota bacterium]